MKNKIIFGVIILAIVAVCIIYKITNTSKQAITDTPIRTDEDIRLGLPADPGETGKQTLEGIDSDKDGVRDDVQRWIALTYSRVPLASATLREYASMSQSLLKVSTVNEASVVATKRSRVAACWERRFPADDRSSLDDVVNQVVNTDARLQAYLDSDRLLGGQTFYSLSSDLTVCDPQQ